MTIYSLDVLLFLFGTSLLFRVQFLLLLPDLHTGFSRGRSGGLVFPLFQNFPQFIVIHAVGFPGGSEVKVSARNAGDLGSIPGSGSSPGEGNGNPLQYSCLENPMDRGAWWVTVHGVAESRTRLSDFTLHSQRLWHSQ